MSGGFTINPLEPKVWADGVEDIDPTTPMIQEGNKTESAHRLPQGLFRSYKDFTDAQIDTIEILLSKLYARFIIADSDYSKFKPTDYPIMEDFYKLCEERIHDLRQATPIPLHRANAQEVCLGIHSMCVGSGSCILTATAVSPTMPSLVFRSQGLNGYQ